MKAVLSKGTCTANEVMSESMVFHFIVISELPLARHPNSTSSLYCCITNPEFAMISTRENYESENIDKISKDIIINEEH